MSKIERAYDAIRREERAKQKARIEEAYAKIPALEAIEREKTQAFLDVAAKKLPPDAAQKQIAALEEQEQALLKENGFAPDALKLHYRCQTCRDTGFLGSGLKKPCACRLLLNAKLDPTVGINDTETFEAFSDSIYPSEGDYISWYTSNPARVKFRGYKIPDGSSRYTTAGVDPTTVSSNNVKEGDVWINTSNQSIGYTYVTQQYLDEYGITPKYTASIGGGWIEATGWWLRSPYVGNSTTFWFVSGFGNCSANSASNSFGVCPCFSI